MKQMFKNISIFALSVCCGVFYSVDSQSKVCFLGDEDCTDNVSFDFNFIDVEEECKKEGYTIKAENCKTPYEYCPHSNMWVKCCNEQEYYYDSCDHNTTEKGRCGYGNNYKYKCECDRSIYAFNNNFCSTRNPVKSADASYSCTEKDYNGNETTLYAKCSCDLDNKYQFKAEDCEAFENSEPQNACSHDYSEGFSWGKDTTTYYAQCGCNRSIYQKDEDTCDLGAFGKICKDSQENTYAENCKSCDGYHDVGELDFVGTSKTQCGFSNGETADGSGYDTTNCTYVICPHDSSKQKIIRCDGENFKSTPADNGKKCVCEDDYELIDNKCVAKMTCNDAVKAFVSNIRCSATQQFGYFGNFGSGSGRKIVWDTTDGSDTVIVKFNSSVEEKYRKAVCVEAANTMNEYVKPIVENMFLDACPINVTSYGCKKWRYIYDECERDDSTGECVGGYTGAFNGTYYSPYEAAKSILSWGENPGYTSSWCAGYDKDKYDKYANDVITACGKTNSTITFDTASYKLLPTAPSSDDSPSWNVLNPLEYASSYNSKKTVQFYGVVLNISSSLTGMKFPTAMNLNLHGGNIDSNICTMAGVSVSCSDGATGCGSVTSCDVCK